MKLYGAYMAANPRRVKVYLAEKGLDIEQVDFDPPYLEMKTPDFYERSPTDRIPVLEMDDGSFLPESTAIIEYIEARHPEPNMLGATDEERARARAITSIVSDLVIPMGNYIRHTDPDFLVSRGLEPRAEIAAFFEPSVGRGLNALEAVLGDKPFLLNDRPMIPDCHCFALFHACIDKFTYELPAKFANLNAWYRRFEERPSAQA